MLEIGRDFAQRNEFVSFVIRLVVNPKPVSGAAVHPVVGGVDPTGQPQGSARQSNQRSALRRETIDEGSEKAFPKRGQGVYVWVFSHFQK